MADSLSRAAAREGLYSLYIYNDNRRQYHAVPERVFCAAMARPLPAKHLRRKQLASSHVAQPPRLCECTLPVRKHSGGPLRHMMARQSKKNPGA